MTKVSASTLARQAAKTTNKAEAKRLRAQAAKLRRVQRASLTGGTQQHLDEIKRMDRAIAEGKHSGIVAGLDPVYMQPDTEQPGHGEIVGGYLSRKAEEITKVARKKGGIDGVQMHLRAMEITARSEANWHAEQRERKAVQATREEMRDKIVCGFLASFDMADETKTMPMVWAMNSTTVASLVEALKANGYSANGRR